MKRQPSYSVHCTLFPHTLLSHLLTFLPFFSNDVFSQSGTESYHQQLKIFSSVHTIQKQETSHQLFLRDTCAKDIFLFKFKFSLRNCNTLYHYNMFFITSQVELFSNAFKMTKQTHRSEQTLSKFQRHRDKSKIVYSCSLVRLFLGTLHEQVWNERKKVNCKK